MLGKHSTSARLRKGHLRRGLRRGLGMSCLEGKLLVVLLAKLLLLLFILLSTCIKRGGG